MKNFKFQISNHKFQIVGLCMILFVCIIQPVYADSAIDKGIDFLKTKQDASGKIFGGYSAPSQWSSIAFTIQNIDVATVKNPSVSLKDFLLTDAPANGAATDFETRILAIVAIGGNPGNFNGTNYVQQLESFVNQGQIGDTCALNDDIFGLLALISSGDLASTSVKQDTLSFIISQQDENGGYSWSAQGCPWYATSPDMTGAAAQALQAAKDHGLTHPKLSEAISDVKNYVLTNQNSDGGFGSFGSDADTTGWALMGLNVLEMKDSPQAALATTWLLSTQQADGGFLSWGGTDSTTTAQAIIALSGRGWLVKIYTKIDSEEDTGIVLPSATPIQSGPTPTITPTPTAAPGLISVMQQIAVTVTPHPTKRVEKNTRTVDDKTAVLGTADGDTSKGKIDATAEETAKPQVQKILIQSFGFKNMLLFIGAGVCALLAIFWFIFRLRATPKL